MPEANGEKQDRWWMSRRAFLSSGAAAGVATVAFGGAGAQGAEKGPANDVDAMVLQVAAAGAVFPVPIETHESEPARARLTGQRVAQARARCSAARVQQAERGAQALIDRKLGGVETNELLKQLSSIAATAGPGELADLQALVAVAAATLVDRFDPEGDVDARLWLRTLAITNERGATPVVGG